MGGGFWLFFNFLFLFGFLKEISLPFVLPDLLSKEKELLFEGKDFIKIDLEEDKLYLISKGEIIYFTKIKAQGMREGWGKTPEGLYFVKRKDLLAWSAISHLYMPYSIHFYGKYYIHGPPYYRDGRYLSSSFSGGCIRIDSLSAKRVFQFAKKGMPVLIIDKKHLKNPSFWFFKKPEIRSKIQAQSFLVADLESGEVFWEKNYLKKYPLGEILYLLVGDVVSENLDLRRKIQKDYNLVDSIFLMLNHLSFDSFKAFWQFFGKEKMLKLLNEKARAIMMDDTLIVSLEDLGQNKTSAKDLFYLGRYVFYNKNPLFEITRGKKVPFLKNFSEREKERQGLFWEKENFLGGIGGEVFNFGKNGLFVFQINQRKIIIVILGSYDIKREVEEILSFFKNENLQAKINNISF